MSQEVGLRLRRTGAFATLGKLDYDGAWFDKAMYGRGLKVSLGIFRWELMKSRYRLKRGKVFKRIGGPDAKMPEIIERAEKFCLELEAGGEDGKRTEDYPSDSRK